MIKIRNRNTQDGVKYEHIPSVVALHQENISMIVNGRPTDPIDKRPFNKCFIPIKIKNCWSNRGLSPFNMNVLKNKKFCHEIGKSESNIDVGEISQDVKNLSEDYEAVKIKLKN